MPESLAQVPPLPKGPEAPSVVKECGIWSWTDLDLNPSSSTLEKNYSTSLCLQFLICKQEMTRPSQEERDDILIRAQNLVGAQKCQLPLLCLSPSLFTDLGLCDLFFETHTVWDCPLSWVLSLISLDGQLPPQRQGPAQVKHSALSSEHIYSQQRTLRNIEAEFLHLLHGR